MENLFAKQDRVIDKMQTSIIRHQMQDINWNVTTQHRYNLVWSMCN